MDDSEQKDSLRLELEKKVIDAFKIFDHEDNDAVDCRDVGPIVRSLGCCPSEAELQTIMAEVEDIEPSSYITLNKFLPAMVHILEEGRYLSSTYDKLLIAFQFLDTDDKGYLTEDQLTEFLQKYGEKFSEEELNELTSAFVDQTTKRVDYRDWITWMVSDD